MRNVTVAAVQFACDWDLQANLARAEALIRRAAAQGAQVILIQELFKAPYFCIDQSPEHRKLAESVGSADTIALFRRLAAELQVVLPCSFFEKANNAYFNTVAMVDADGAVMGLYRKTHIPNGPAYQEKQYFTPGDTGFKVWPTRYGKIGVGICWDQWFPETARCMALQGAEMLLFPTAIGSEPAFPEQDSQPHWTVVHQGHAGMNLLPVIASNRIGTERSRYEPGLEMTFYGSSLIADHHGQIVAQASRDQEEILLHTFDLDAIATDREGWFVFRDRRPSLYRALLTMDCVNVDAAAHF